MWYTCATRPVKSPVSSEKYTIGIVLKKIQKGQIRLWEEGACVHPLALYCVLNPSINYSSHYYWDVPREL